MFAREKSLDGLIDLFDHVSASRAEVLKKALVSAMQLADADGSHVRHCSTVGASGRALPARRRRCDV